MKKQTLWLKRSVLVGVALVMGTQLALAQSITVKDIDSAGLPPGMVRMSSNENPMGPSSKAVEAVMKYIHNSNRYSWYELDENGNPKSLNPGTLLAKALAKVDGVALPINFNPRSDETPYFFAAGSGRILKLLSIAYLSRGDGEVIEAEIAYGDISEEAEELNERGIPTNVIRVPMTKDYRHDLDAMLKAITPKTSLVVITNPNNPTGTLLTYKELDNFVNAAPKHVVIVIDEAYIHFVDDPDYQKYSAIPLALTNDNVIVVRTFSKVYGIRGILLGYSVASSKINERMSIFNTGRASALAQIAGTAAVEDQEHFQKSRQAVLDSKKLMYEAFDELDLEYIPSQSSFVLVNVGRDSQNVRNEMWKRRVSISTRGSQHMEGWIRISAGTSDETEVFLSTLKTVLTKVL